MKNMKKLLQRAMVFTLSAAMLVGTPMTASAAGLVDLYSISDGDKTVVPGNDTGTVTNTDTNTGFLIGENVANIVGIALDRETVNAEAGGATETLKATVVVDTDLGDATDEVVEALSGKIKWQVLYTDANGNKREDMPNPTEKVAIEGKADNRSEITLRAKQGTALGEEVTVRATIDASYYFKADNMAELENAVKDDSITWNNKYIFQDEARKGAVYTADATVSVKEYATSLVWENNKDEAESTIYPKQTLNLKDLVKHQPDTANDAITWSSSDTKVATVNATTGVVTAKKEGTAKVTAVSERGKKAVRTITVGKSVKADVVKIFSVGADGKEEAVTAPINKDLGTASDMTLRAKMYAKVDAYTDAQGKVIETVKPAAGKEDEEVPVPADANHTKIEVENGTWYIDANKKAKQVEITDVITWTSNKATVATVAANGKVTLKGVGTAAITAKATGGKSAKATVKVDAVLTKLEIGNVPADKNVYSGLSYELTAIKTPFQNKDAVKWAVTDASGNKTKDASISAKGVLKIANKVADGTKIKVTLAPKKGTTPVPATVELTVKQSSIDGFTISEVNGETLAQVKINAKGKAEQVIKKAGTSTINVPLSKSYKATVDGAAAKAANGLELLTWKTSNAKVAKISGTGANATIKAEAAGKATITVSGVYYDSTNDKASVISTKFTVQVKQPVTTLTMNKPTVTLAEKANKDQKVALKVTFGPKKADKSQTKIASWTVQQIAGPGAGAPVDNTDAKAQKASYTVNLTKPVKGNVYKITATSITGAKATSTVTIVAPTVGVQIVKSDNTEFDKKGADMKVGDPQTGVLKIKSQINIGTKASAKWVDAGSKADNAEDVTYTVNKKGIVSIDKDGNVYAIKKGNVTITAKTPTGKKATLKVKVSE